MMQFTVSIYIPHKSALVARLPAWGRLRLYIPPARMASLDDHTVVGLALVYANLVHPSVSEHKHVGIAERDFALNDTRCAIVLEEIPPRVRKLLAWGNIKEENGVCVPANEEVAEALLNFALERAREMGARNLEMNAEINPAIEQNGPEVNTPALWDKLRHLQELGKTALEELKPLPGSAPMRGAVVVVEAPGREASAAVLPVGALPRLDEQIAKAALASPAPAEDAAPDTDAPRVNLEAL